MIQSGPLALTFRTRLNSHQERPPPLAPATEAVMTDEEFLRAAIETYADVLAALTRNSFRAEIDLIEGWLEIRIRAPAGWFGLTDYPDDSLPLDQAENDGWTLWYDPDDGEPEVLVINPNS